MYIPMHVGTRRSVVSQFNNSSFMPIYPNWLPTVPKPSRASRTASLVVNNLEASQSAITRLLNRLGVLKTSNEGSNPSLSAN
jgi:hypothetical protein